MAAANEVTWDGQTFAPSNASIQQDPRRFDDMDHDDGMDNDAIYPTPAVVKNLEILSDDIPLNAVRHGLGRRQMKLLRNPLGGPEINDNKEAFVDDFRSMSVESDRKLFLKNWPDICLGLTLSHEMLHSIDVLYLDGWGDHPEYPPHPASSLNTCTLTEVIRACSSLTVLKARNITLLGTNDEMSELANAIRGLHHVCLIYVKSTHMTGLVSGLKHVHTVEIFGDCELEAADYKEVIAAGSSVRSFTMHGDPALDVFRELGDVFITNANETLHELCIPYAKLFTGIDGVCSMLGRFTSLKKLFIEVGGIEDAKKVFITVQQMRSLTDLAVVIRRRGVHVNGRTTSIEHDLITMLRMNTNIKQLFIQQQFGEGPWSSLVIGKHVLSELELNRLGREVPRSRLSPHNEDYGNALAYAGELGRPDIFYQYLRNNPGIVPQVSESAKTPKS